jgi:hypothetical protein
MRGAAVFWRSKPRDKAARRGPVFNPKTAKSPGVKLLPTLLARADRMLE